jgi:predicted transcriptional regulator
VNPTSKTVSFRLHDHHFRRLEELADTSHTSPGDEARTRLIALLEDHDRFVEMRERLSNLEAQVSTLHRNLAISTQALLLATTQGKKISPEEAETWVRENLRQPSS